MLSTKIGDQKF